MEWRRDESVRPELCAAMNTKPFLYTIRASNLSVLSITVAVPVQRSASQRLIVVGMAGMA